MNKNFLIISPNYPRIYYKFCARLKARGFNVFGIGDVPANQLSPELAGTLSEYVQISSLGNYTHLLDTARYIEGKYGKLFGLESNNECWLENDAKLRRDLGVEGLLPEKLESFQYKSKMKALFRDAGVASVPFAVTRAINEVQDFINKYDYPIFAKPNRGIGARGVQKISNVQELENFFRNPLPEDFIFEIYIEGNLYSYDGLTDKQGNIIFEAAHHFTMPIDKLKVTGAECIYYTLRDIPDKLGQAGRRAVAAASLAQRFFHIEFFELTKPIKDIGDIGDIVGIEVNMRPAGGLTPEMINIAKNINIYELWADCVLNNTVPRCNVSNDFYCINIGRHNRKKYLHSIEQIQEKYAGNFIFSGTTDMQDNPYGNEEIISKFASFEESQDFCAYVTETIS